MWYIVSRNCNFDKNTAIIPLEGWSCSQDGRCFTVHFRSSDEYFHDCARIWMGRCCGEYKKSEHVEDFWLYYAEDDSMMVLFRQFESVVPVAYDWSTRELIMYADSFVGCSVGQLGDTYTSSLYHIQSPEDAFANIACGTVATPELSEIESSVIERWNSNVAPHGNVGIVRKFVCGYVCFDKNGKPSRTDYITDHNADVAKTTTELADARLFDDCDECEQYIAGQLDAVWQLSGMSACPPKYPVSGFVRPVFTTTLPLTANDDDAWPVFLSLRDIVSYLSDNGPKHKIGEVVKYRDNDYAIVGIEGFFPFYKYCVECIACMNPRCVVRTIAASDEGNIGSSENI